MPSVLNPSSSLSDIQSVLAGDDSKLPQTKPVKLRGFADIPQMRTNIFDKVQEAAGKIGPLENARHTLNLTDLSYVDPDHISLDKQKQAILTGKSLHRRLRGTWSLKDNATNQELDRQQMTVAQVPYMTDRGTFVINGTEYTLANQMRLRPGIFTRIKNNGEIESHVNTMPGNGVSHRYFLDPETGIFKISLGQAKLNLLPIMKAMGATDKELRNVWGDELLAINSKARDDRSLAKFYQRVIKKADPEAPEEDKANAVRQYMEGMKLDPEVTKRTLGKHHVNLHKTAMLDTTRKLLKVSRQEEEPDDRDHMAFQMLYGPEDLLSERITRDKAYLRQLLWKASFKGDLSRMQPGVLTRQLHSTLLNTGLGQASEEINSGELLDAMHRSTRLGEGGIASLDAVPDESRSIQNSYFGFIDPIKTPECYAADMQVFTKEGWVNWPYITENTELACLIGGRIAYYVPVKITAEKYKGDMYVCENKDFKFSVTPNHRLSIQHDDTENNSWEIVIADILETFKNPVFRCGGVKPALGKEIELNLFTIIKCIEDHGCIPDEVFNAQIELRHIVMEYCIGGFCKQADIHREEKVFTFTCSNNILSDHIMWLATTMGYATKKVSETRFTIYRELTAHSTTITIKSYTGKVYCATVPGGLLYVRWPGKLGHWSGNSFKVGIDNRLSSTAKKGDDGRVYAPFTDVKTGKTNYMSPQQLPDSVVAFPGEMKKNKPYVAAMDHGEPQFVPRESVEYELPHMENAFSPLANMIPMKSAIKGQRMSMGARYLSQAVPLTYNEAPLVQAAMPGQHMQRSFSDEYGKYMGAVFAKDGGIVKKVTKDGIVVKYDNGETHEHELYSHFPYSRKTEIHNTPSVAVGDKVTPNQLLAKSNFTDNKGTVAFGINPRIAFLPYLGKNYEDSTIISQTMANKLQSEHMYVHDQDWNDNIAKGTKRFISLFPTEYEKQQLANMDEHGVVKPGTILKYGDPITLVAEQKERTHSQIHRGRKPTYSNNSITWDHHADGEVTDVAHTSKGVAVAVKASDVMHVGDKLSNLHGGKGIVGAILPDDQMPHDSEGKPFEMLYNPLGMISRINPAQIAETVLGKIAKKTGIPYKIEDFADINDLAKFAKDELVKHGMSSTETVTDPATGRQIPNVLTGYQNILKLQHMAEGKGQGRGIGGYTSEDQPARGGAEGSKTLSLLESGALLSHGATEFLRDAHVVRGQRNDAYWQAFMSGFRPQEPSVPLVYKKFVDNLKGSGINVIRHGQQLHVMALTDKDVNALAGPRNLQNVDTVDWKRGLKPKTGGLFDPALTAGHLGNKWSAIRLNEPLPNPAFEEPIRRLLDLTQNRFESVLAGKESIPNFGTGPKAIKDAISNINIDKAITSAETDIKSGKRTLRDVAVKKLGYLQNAKRLGIQPKDWILSRVPVLPPMYRPVSVMSGNQNQLISDPNYLYRELFDANDAMKELKARGVDDISQERMNVYNAFKGVVGIGDPIQAKNQEKGIKGLLKHIFGDSPKFGTVQRQLLGASTELVGRSVISPNPDLNIDQVGLPEGRAWEVYKPFVIRRLVQKGMPRLAAAEAFNERKPIARDMLVAEMDNRPVVLSRAPVLHRYGIMGALPQLIKGETMQMNPMITKGFNLDYDGDNNINIVMMLLTSQHYNRIINSSNAGFRSFLELRRMASFKTLTNYRAGFEYFCVNLEDFPHEAEYTEHGHIRVHNVPQGIFVVSHNEKIGTSIVAEVTSWSEHKDREVEIVTLQSGRQLLVDDDPRAVYGYDIEKNEYGRWRPAEAIGKYVPRVHELPENYSQSAHSITLPRSLKLKSHTRFTFDFGYMLGALTGDGWVTHTYNEVKGEICLAGINSGVTDKFKQSLLSVYLDMPHIRTVEGNSSSYGESKKLIFNCKELAEWLVELIGRGAQKKHLPPFYLTGGEDFRLGLTAGLLDTDGSICVLNGKSKPQLAGNFTSTSIRLVNEVQNLLRSFAVSSRISPCKTPAGEPCYTLSICMGELKKTKLEVFHTEKRKIFIETPAPNMLNSAASGRQVNIPINSELICELTKHITSKVDATLYSSLRRAIKVGVVTRYTANKAIDYVSDKTINHPSWATFKQMVANADIRWDKVISYEKTGIKETGYDLTVPDSETFMSVDGVILSNTMNYHVPASEEARKEVLEKMLPSKNLLSSSDFKVHQLPGQEYQLGLYHASTARNDKTHPHVFATEADAIKAYKEGRIALDTPVEVLKH